MFRFRDGETLLFEERTLPSFLPPCYIGGSMAGIRSSRQGSSDKPDEYANFERALKKVLSVSHDEIKARLDAAKRARQRQKRASGRASRAKD